MPRYADPDMPVSGSRPVAPQQPSQPLVDVRPRSSRMLGWVRRPALGLRPRLAPPGGRRRRAGGPDRL